ncbi:hypothetical protein [Asticcacaulis tiandongensis]|uniref:hypothetical protein n=1 Tax=Asticcacaulis tiandongensis TaxID=2565365 RepID=UPI00112E8918|nr:hypothetical protein [Asticcacaulis tiandongensis]
MNLLYIDEEPAEGNRVIRAAYRSGHFSKSEVSTILPLKNMEEMIEYIVESKCQVVISDYKLGDKKTGIQYDGLDLVREFQDRYEGYPCFLMTNYVGEALNHNIDVNVIFPKSDLEPDENGKPKTELPFFTRVKAKIDEHQTTIQTKAERLIGLQNLSAERALTADELQEALDLDDFLEAAMSKNDAVPRLLKESALAPFNSILQKAEELLGRLEVEIKNKSGN